MPRLSQHWNQREAPRTASQTASALSVNIWRLASDGLLKLENEGFETETWSQRLDVIGHFSIFAAHLVDRTAQQHLDGDARQKLLTALIQHLATLMQDNRLQADGEGAHDAAFIAQFNSWSERYAPCDWSEQEGPGFSLCRELGDAVAACMGAHDNAWIATYVIDREAPRLAKALACSLRNLMPARKPG